MSSPKVSSNFEDAMQELEKITKNLESGTLSLDDAVQAYEKGMHLSRLCQEILKKAEYKLEYIRRNDSGEIETKPIPNEELETNALSQERLFQ